MKAKFGPAGNSDSFYEEGHKSSLEMPAWLNRQGLSLYEYQCGRGVKMSRDSAQDLCQNAKQSGVELSIHSPYYINLASDDPERQEKTVNYIRQTLTLASYLDAKRIVVHMGSPGKRTRLAGMKDTEKLLQRILDMMKNEGFYGKTHLCLETMGKVNQLGTVEEVIKMCRLDDSFLPCIDFGHVNARTQGSLSGEKAFSALFDQIENALGFERMNEMHCHVSKIEYTNMGEKKHLTFEDTQYGPDYTDLAKVIAKRGTAQHLICESAGTQSEDALKLKNMVVQEEKSL